MFSILKLVIIILLNETYAHISQNTEIILLPASNPTGAKKIPIALKVFGRLIQLNLRRNDRIVSPAFGIWKYNANRVTEKLLELNLSNPCYYYHEDHISYAAINFCHEDGLKGHVFVENKTLEIHPLRNEFKLMCLIDDFREETNFSFGKPHLIKRSLEYFADSNSYHWDKFELNRRHVHNAQQNLTAKLAIFIDKSAYDKLIFFLHYNYIMVNEEISQYVNRIQAAFNYPNLNVFLKILVVRINILVNQPSNLAVWHGNSAVDRVLDLFCKYANSLNPTDDDNPNHWDIGLYLTGIDLYEDIQVKHKAHYRTHRDFKITGKAHIDGVCDRRFSCAVAEYRDKSEFIYSLNAVNEIGHLLGITEERDFKNLETLKAWDKDSSKKMKNLWERKTCLREQAISKKITPETIIPKTENNDNNNTRQNLTIELAVFFDEAAYHMYMPLLDNNKRELRNMILAYVNQIQAMFHHPSFGTPLDISLVRLKIMKEQPSDFPVFDGDVIQLLDSFCNYATTQNPRDDNDPHHWDISLYLTGINIYSKYNQQRYYEPITEFFRNGACVPFNSCIIVEFGFNKSIHSAFATSRAAAHAIGRLLGMDDDNGSINSTCPKGEYIMTDWLYHRGQITWSECSRNSAKKLWKTKECLLDRTRRENPADPYALDHLRYHDLPGREWTAKAQCELFLRDNDANVVTLDDICQVLQCETPHKKKYFFAGPALDGSHCALGKECRGGKCEPVLEKIYNFKYCERDKWSEWEEQTCNSNCLKNSKGARIKRRFCKHRIHKTANCKGPYYDVVLCNDSNLCTKSRKTIFQYTAIKCTKFKRTLEEYKRNSHFKIKKFMNEPATMPGLQMPHNGHTPWAACTVICQRKDKINTYYSPRLDMLELGIDPYFPDGTWCYNKDGQNYYCRQHYCLPENYLIEE